VVKLHKVQMRLLLALKQEIQVNYPAQLPLVIKQEKIVKI
jgi:hypothetical protein